jgi:protein involved in polysaccharide export with SLBB domain
MFRDNFPRSSEVTWKRIRVLIVLPLLFAAAAAAQNQGKSTPEPEGPAPNAAKPLPGLDDPAVSGAHVDSNYLIGANDVLYVQVFENELYTHLYPVSPDGMITLARYPEVKAEGLTRTQLGTKLKEMLSKDIRNPDVNVTVWQVLSKKYTVAGGVKRTGSFPLIQATTVAEAINDAGGFLDAFSNKTDITILRDGKPFAHFNYNDYVKGKHPEKNIFLQNGDTIYVK